MKKMTLPLSLLSTSHLAEKTFSHLHEKWVPDKTIHKDYLVGCNICLLLAQTELEINCNCEAKNAYFLEGRCDESSYCSKKEKQQWQSNSREINSSGSTSPKNLGKLKQTKKQNKSICITKYNLPTVANAKTDMANTSENSRTSSRSSSVCKPLWLPNSYHFVFTLANKLQLPNVISRSPKYNYANITISV